MTLDEVRIEALPMVLATDVDVDALEERLWVRFPVGYREYVTTLGEGNLCGIRVYPPWQIAAELKGWRQRLDDFWFWEEGKDTLPKERALECVVLGDTIGGDDVLFHPLRPDRLFVLPHEDKQVHVAGADLMSAVEWICKSGVIWEASAAFEFTPFDSRGAAPPPASAVVDPPLESFNELRESVRKWIERHAARKDGQKFARNRTKRGESWKLLHEGIVAKGIFPYSAGYLAAFQILDGNGEERGVLTWTANSDGSTHWFETRLPDR